MLPVHEVMEEEVPPAAAVNMQFFWMAWSYLGVGAILLEVIGTWLVWFSAFIQRHHHEEEIRAACRRVMPDNAERCYDTVIIQRSGVRR